jgi:hypothetical protein
VWHVPLTNPISAAAAAANLTTTPLLKLLPPEPRPHCTEFFPATTAHPQEVKDGSNDAQQAQERLAQHSAAAPALAAWLGSFHKLQRPVEGSGPKGEVLAAAEDVARSILAARAAAQSAQNAAAAASTAKQVGAERSNW